MTQQTRCELAFTCHGPGSPFTTFCSMPYHLTGNTNLYSSVTVLLTSGTHCTHKTHLHGSSDAQLASKEMLGMFA